MNCPSCNQNVAASSYCSNCGEALVAEQSRTGDSVAGGIASGLAVGFGLVVLTLAKTFVLEEGTRNAMPAEFCAGVRFVAAVLVVVGAFGIALIVPPVRRSMLMKWNSANVDAFALAFGLTLFLPFVPCNMLFTFNRLFGPECPLR